MFLSFRSCWTVGKTKFWILMIDFVTPSLIYSGISIQLQAPYLLNSLGQQSRSASAQSCTYSLKKLWEAPSGTVESINCKISNIKIYHVYINCTSTYSFVINLSPFHAIYKLNAPSQQLLIYNKEQNKTMFNTHTAQKHKKYQQELEQEAIRQRQWKIRYTTEIQPDLVSRFHRRINGFAKKMEDDPFVVKNRRDGSNDDALVRQFDKSLNVSKKNWRLRNEEDWNSIFTPIERIDRRDAKSFFKGKPNDFMSLRSIGSLSIYNNSKIEYRFRQKQKQINPPMRYTNRHSELKKQSLLPTLSRSKRVQTETDALRKKKLIGNTVALIDSDNEREAQNMSHLDMDSFSINNNSFVMRNKNPESMSKTEKEIIQEEEMKALAQNRLYFKSLIDLEQNVRSLKQRHNIKEILVKCGIFKPTTGKKYQQQEIDRFLQMMKTRQ